MEGRITLQPPQRMHVKPTVLVIGHHCVNTQLTEVLLFSDSSRIYTCISYLAAIITKPYRNRNVQCLQIN